ncbi:hypothetical protein OMP38_18810 [Cohnella ginsengisoli]|uniref:Uncharacterized protein n=1 Tax=Cohnella ginsengisoli TaxID=425004 RepID=A0A9X4KII4_9BACL|nr:hypothetical protein [Cohnella ginsengisoli]MDG0792698.1 hypothetical protein [Cohnella ginsengisoli]
MRRQILALVGNVDEPRLVVNARANLVDLVLRQAERFGDLLVAMLHAVAQADDPDAAGAPDGPRIHRHRVGIVEQQRVRRELPHVLGDVEQHRDRAKREEYAAGAERVADALLDAVLERDLDVVAVRLETADASEADDVVGVLDRFALAGRRHDLNVRQAVRLEHALAQLGHHLERLRIDVHQPEFGIAEFGHRHQVHDQPAGKVNASGPDHCDFQHFISTSV